MSQPIRTGICLVLCAIALGVAPGADAAYYSLPGNHCGAGNASVAGYIDGLIQAKTSGTPVFCPILRRAPDAQNITDIYVSVRDGSSQQHVECMVRACNPNGSGCANSSIVSTTDAFIGATVLSLGSVAGFNNGLAFLSCTLPSPGTLPGEGKSHLTQYRWND